MLNTYRVEYTRHDGTLSPVNGDRIHMTWFQAANANDAAEMIERSHAGWKGITITTVIPVQQNYSNASYPSPTVFG